MKKEKSESFEQFIRRIIAVKKPEVLILNRFNWRRGLIYSKDSKIDNGTATFMGVRVITSEDLLQEELLFI